MKKYAIILGIFVFSFALTYNIAFAAKPSACATIQGGTITDKNGVQLVPGFDKWGYNYQAHIFDGYAGNYTRPAVPVTSGDKLVMKWSDAWLANVDCNGDHKLDRGLVDGVVSGVSMGWETNHYVGSYIDENGNAQKYTDFYKIVWVGPGGNLWGQYKVLQEVYNDTGSGNYRFKDGNPGFGLNNHWTAN